MLSGLVEYFHPMHKERLDRENTHHKSTTQLITVPTKRFSEIYSNGTIDYLSIDVEGAEMAVLESIDWDTTQIQWIGIEDNYNDTRMHDFLVQRGYRCVTSMGCDKMYNK
jgi:hypothetical protein